MAARSISTATISFGLVSVPVNLYSSAESKASVSFNMLHKKCNGRLKQQYICPVDNNEVVTRDETVKGYEFSKGQYVVLSPEELKALEEKATSTIDIIEFVPLASVVGTCWMWTMFPNWKLGSVTFGSSVDTANSARPGSDLSFASSHERGVVGTLCSSTKGWRLRWLYIVMRLAI